MGYRNRLPNDCGWLFGYSGCDIRGLRLLLYIAADAYSLMYEKGACSFNITYSRFRRKIPQMENQTNRFFSDCIRNALCNAEGYESGIACVRTGETSVSVKYDRSFTDIVSSRVASGYFTFMFDDVVRLPSVNSVKLYMMYRKNYGILAQRVFRDSDIVDIFGIHTDIRKNMYRAIRKANVHLAGIGVRYTLERRENVWRFVNNEER